MNPADPSTPRRQFLWDMGAGFAGLALTSLREGEGFFGREDKGEVHEKESRGGRI